MQASQPQCLQPANPNITKAALSFLSCLLFLAVCDSLAPLVTAALLHLLPPLGYSGLQLLCCSRVAVGAKQLKKPQCTSERRRTWHRHGSGLVDRAVGSKLRALNEAEDDGVFLTDQALPDVVQGQRQTVIYRVAAQQRRRQLCWGRWGHRWGSHMPCLCPDLRAGSKTAIWLEVPEAASYCFRTRLKLQGLTCPSNSKFTGLKYDVALCSARGQYKETSV